MINMSQDAIKRFQKYFSVIRVGAGWTQTELAKILGVSRSTVINKEHGKSDLTKIEYLAIRGLLNELYAEDDWLDASLKDAVTILVDRDDLPDDIRLEAEEAIFYDMVAYMSFGRGRSTSILSEKLLESFNEYVLTNYDRLRKYVD